MDLSKLIFMPQVNSYDGNYEVDFDEWSENLTNFFEAFMPNLTDEQKILHLKTYLSGQAREKFKEIDLTTAKTLKDVLAKLKELCQSEVGRSLGLLNLSLMKPKEPNEDLDDFVEKFRKVVKQATIGLEEDFVKMKMLDEFILKLDPEMAYYVRDKEPKDFNTAVEYAKKHEILSKLRKINIMKSSINLLKNPNLKEDEIIDELADCLAERLRLYGPGRNSSSSNNSWHDSNEYVAYKKGTFSAGYYRINNIKGDLEIINITATCDDGITREVMYHRFDNSFMACLSGNGEYTFYITANVVLKEINGTEYQLKISASRLALLKAFQFFKDKIVLPNCQVSLTYYIKKIKESTENDIEIHIVNPHDIKIEGKRGDYIIQQSSTKDIYLKLSIFYDPVALNKYCDDAFMKEISEVFSSDTDKSAQHKSAQASTSADKSPTVDSQSCNKASSKFYKMLSNNRYADVFLISSDTTKIPSHRCLLAEFSPIFGKIIDDATEHPLTINVENFDAETIKAALDYLYGNLDSLNGKEMEVFKFAAEYDIKELKESCRIAFEESVNPSNVCEYIQIAYSNNFEELKQKCLNILYEKRKVIDASKFANLPKNILSDFITSF